MQKKKNVTKKTVQVDPVEQKVVGAQSQGKKDFSKPLSFFAVFVFCLCLAAVYPYVIQEEPINFPVKTQSTNKNFVLEEPDFIREIDEVQEEEAQEETQPIIEQPDCSVQKQTILEQQKIVEDLEQKVHQLELENLNLKEQTTSSEKSALLSIRLLNEIYAGRPFVTPLKELLKHNPTDTFALAIQENLGEYAQIGIATPEKLKQLFKGLI